MNMPKQIGTICILVLSFILTSYASAATTLYGGSRGGNFYSVDVVTGEQTQIGNPLANWGVEALAFSPDGKTLYGGSGGGNFYSVDVVTGEQTQIGNPLANWGVEALAFSPDGKTLYGGSRGGNFYSVDVVTGEQTQIGNPLANWGVEALAFSPPLAPIPEPETYAMLLAGLGLLGLTARRRKLKS